MQISLTKALALLSNATAVIVDGYALTFPETYTDEPGEYANEFLHVGWWDANVRHDMAFLEGDNQTVTVHGSRMYLVNEDGETTNLLLLRPYRLEPVPDEPEVASGGSLEDRVEHIEHDLSNMESTIDELQELVGNLAITVRSIETRVDDIEVD